MTHFLTQAESFLPILLLGLRYTIIVAVGAFLLSTAFGLEGGCGRLSCSHVPRIFPTDRPR